MRFLLLFSCILIFRSQADVRRKVGKSGGQIGIQGLLSEMVLFLLELVSIMSKIWRKGRQVPPSPFKFRRPCIKQLSLLEFRIAVERKPES